MSCRVIALTFGYVESSTTSWLIYSTEDKHSIPTRKEALHSLTAYLYDKFQKESETTRHTHNTYKTHMAQCCYKAWLRRLRDVADPTNCPTCGASYLVKEEESFSLDDWHEYLNRLHSSDADSYGEHDWPDNPERWTPWGYTFDAPSSEVLLVQEHAAEILTMALAEIHPELKDHLVDDQEEWPNLKDTEYYLVRDYYELLEENT